MFMPLDGKGPLYAQLTRALKQALASGRLGGKLPATRTLAREMGLSRNTVLAAYEQLQAEGYLDGRVGSGSFATPGLPGRTHAAPMGAGRMPPQSAFACRARAFHDHDAMPGRAIEGVRIQFQYGVPLTNPALTSAWAREVARAAVYTSPGYPGTQGLVALRESICDYLARRRGVLVEPEDVLVVSGTQQAISLAARVLLDPGAEALLEEPHYFALREVLQVHGASVITAPVDEHGLVVDALPAKAPRLMCVTPSHQFPTGALMSLARRLQLLQYARDHDSWIFEDDYDGEFRYDVQPLAALRALDQAGRVIYVGTFSKAMFPSLRLGYLVMPRGLREDFITAKWQDDFGSPAIEQAAMARFMDDGGFERHLKRTWKTLKQRREALITGLQRCSRGRLALADSHAGMHLVAWLARGSHEDCDALIEQARRRGLGLYPIAPHFMGKPARPGLLFGYCGLSTNEIEEALVILEASLDDVMPVDGKRASVVGGISAPPPPLR